MLPGIMDMSTYCGLNAAWHNGHEWRVSSAVGAASRGQLLVAPSSQRPTRLVCVVSFTGLLASRTVDECLAVDPALQSVTSASMLRSPSFSQLLPIIERL